MLEGLRKPPDLIVIVVTLLAYGCPIQAIVHAFGLDERTVASWRDRAGKHCQKLHHAVVEQGKLDLVHVQADAHSGERTPHDRLDGTGPDGVDSPVAGRSSECPSGSQLGRSVVASGARLLPTVASHLGVYRWLGSVPGEHSAGVS
jgi:hypothetical protein